MTAMVGVIVPVMIIIGTFIGSRLRYWSREAQGQVFIIHPIILWTGLKLCQKSESSFRI